MFFLGHSCFCEKPVSPSLIRFLPFLLFMHKVALVGLTFGGLAFCWYTYIYRCMIFGGSKLVVVLLFEFFQSAFTCSASVVQRHGIPAQFARPCECLIPALFVCLFQSLHKIALQSSAHSLRPFSRSPSTIPLDSVRFSGGSILHQKQRQLLWRAHKRSNFHNSGSLIC